MSSIELLCKKIFDNLKHVTPTTGETSNYLNGGAYAPRTYDFKLINEMKEERNKDVNMDKKDV